MPTLSRRTCPGLGTSGTLQGKCAALQAECVALREAATEKDAKYKRLQQQLSSALYQKKRAFSTLAETTEATQRLTTRVVELEEHKTESEAQHLAHAMAGSAMACAAAAGGGEAGGSGGAGSASAATHSVRLVIDLTGESPPSLDEEEEEVAVVEEASGGRSKG